MSIFSQKGAFPETLGALRGRNLLVGFYFQWKFGEFRVGSEESREYISGVTRYVALEHNR